MATGGEGMLFKDFDLTGQSAVIFGGGRGIGKGIGLVFAEAGADVLVASRTKEEVEQTASEIRGLGRKGIGISADATKTADVNSVVEKAISEFGKVDILVNSAGLGYRKPIVPLPGYKPGWVEANIDVNVPTTDQEYYHQMDLYLTSVFLATRAVGPHMIERKKGNIINISSAAGVHGYALQVLYCTAKAAVIMYTRSLALEWGRYNIRVNAIGPGYIETKLTSSLTSDPERKAQLIRSVPLRRIGQPRDVGLLALYMASPASGYLTGQAIFLDGGESA
jgi:NAD(P)-dependent dehydrogenase (short-subunit alcohol dehydrogenase family)